MAEREPCSLCMHHTIPPSYWGCQALPRTRVSLSLAAAPAVVPPCSLTSAVPKMKPRVNPSDPPE